MTPEEYASEAAQAFVEAEKKLVAIMEDEIRKAVLVEREACAKVVEEVWRQPHADALAVVGLRAAAAIRARP